MFKVMDERGQMLPFIAIMLVILLLFAAYSISTTMMFMQRKTVEDALDAAILSAAMASVEERHKATYYYDWREWVCTDRDPDTGSCRSGYYVVRQGESYPKNYIYVKLDAKQILKNAFLRNLYENAPQAELKSLRLDLEYDDERFILVRKRLKYLHGGSGNTKGRSYNPSSWWLGEFGATIGFMNKPEKWSSEEYEDRIVRFPRWVKLTATAEVEVPSIMGGVFSGGSNTVVVTVKASAVRELLEVDRPVWNW